MGSTKRTSPEASPDAWWSMKASGSPEGRQSATDPILESDEQSTTMIALEATSRAEPPSVSTKSTANVAISVRENGPEDRSMTFLPCLERKAPRAS